MNKTVKITHCHVGFDGRSLKFLLVIDAREGTLDGCLGHGHWIARTFEEKTYEECETMTKEWAKENDVVFETVDKHVWGTWVAGAQK